MAWNLFLGDAFVKNGNGVEPPYGESRMSLDLNGADEYVSIPGNSTLRGFGSGDIIVISCWIRYDERTSAVSSQLIRNDRSASTDSQYGLALFTDVTAYPNKKATLQFSFDDSGGVERTWGTTGKPITIERWHHIVVMHEYGDGSNFLCYVDGVSQAGSWSGGEDNAPATNSEDISIGVRNNNGSRLWYYSGWIDQLEIYKSATTWSAAELQELFDTSLGAGLGVPIDGTTHSTRNADIIAQYTLGENDDAGANGIKETINNYDGTGTNLEASSFSDMSAGYYGVQFDGASSNINCGSGAGIDNSFSGGGSWSAWVCAFSDGENNLGRIFSKTDIGDTNGCHFRLEDESGGFCRLGFRVATDATAGVWRTDRIIPLRRFTHVGVVFDSDTLATPTLIVDGDSVTVNTVTSPTGSYVGEASDDLLIGSNLADNRTFDGQIYSAAIFLSSLTAAHWAEVYSGVVGTNDTGQPPDLEALATTPAPEAWWMWMDAIVTGASGISDLTGNGHDGTMGGNAIILNVGP